MSDRGKSVIRDPAVAIAASKCWLSTWVKRAGSIGGVDINSFHPGECTFCDYDRDAIISALEEFTAWAGVSTHEDSPIRMEVESFLTLSALEQTRLVMKAQGRAEPAIDARNYYSND